PVNAPILASIGVNGAGLPLTMSQLVAGRPQSGLYAGFSSLLVCAQLGSPLPAMIDFADLISAGTSFSSIRVTEGFADSFQPRSGVANLNADSGERIIVSYSGFPQDAQLFVPDVIAGSDAVQPTAGGDFELPASGGAYAPSVEGSLLLARVNGAASNGAGGAPVYAPGAIGSGTVTFNSVSALSIVNGSAYVVYEVVDANNSAIESAQFPTFLGLAPDGNRQASQTSASVFFAPQSAVIAASATEALPRFRAIPPQPDCPIVGDCSTYLPALSLNTTSLQFSSGSSQATQQGVFIIHNTGGGVLNWKISVSYGSGSGWLSVDPYQGANDTAVRVYANPVGVAPGVYTGTLTINGGQYAGAQSIAVTFVVTGPPPPPSPTIASVVNAASLLKAPAVPGSLSTIFGSNFTGKNVSATFDGAPAAISFSDGAQINLLVPSSLGPQSSSQLVVTVDGTSSSPYTVSLAPFAPAIFSGGVFNQDWTPNDSNHPAAAGSVLQIFATGLSGAGAITGRIGDRDIPAPDYAGPAPGLPGVQQINLAIPPDLGAATASLYVCGMSPGAAPVCSLPIQLTIK
ncbi:MAG TPA: IPT/TIG domain-containing protein, partial [Bryobacteraceae bacterium]|nr:IPT/TIG domain-containing protein [Bryobacteraceae bacterium]